MNFKKLIILLSIVNILEWGYLELWSYKYANSSIAIGTGILIVFHLLGYYIVVISVTTPKSEPKKEE